MSLFYRQQIRRALQTFIRPGFLPNGADLPDEAFAAIEEQARRNFNEQARLLVRRSRAENVASEDEIESGSRTVKEDYYRFQDELDFGVLHPVVLARPFIEKRVSAKAEPGKRNKVELLLDIMRKSFPIDPVTGYYEKQTMPSIVGHAHFNAQGSAIPVCLVEGDFTNLAGNNDVFRREITDRLVHLLCERLQRSLEEAGRDFSPPRAVEVHAVRAGGDEIRLVVYGLEKSDLVRLLHKKIQPEMNLLAAEFGAHATPHHKLGSLPGFGLALACADLRREGDEEVMRTSLARLIKARKEVDGLQRFGMMDEADAERFLQEIRDSEPARKSDAETLERALNATREKLGRPRPGEPKPDWKKATASYWKSLRAGDSKFHAAAAESGAKNPRAVLDHWQKKKWGEGEEHPWLPTIKDRLAVEERIPFYDQIVIQREEPPEATRLRKAFKALGHAELADAPEDVLEWNIGRRRLEPTAFLARYLQEHADPALPIALDLMRFFDAPDPTSHCKSESLMHYDAKEFQARHGGMKVLLLRLDNLSGLNNVDTRLADRVLRETGKIIFNTVLAHHNGLEQRSVDYVYHKGGGDFVVLLPPDYPEDLLKKIKNRVRGEVADMAKQPLRHFLDQHRLGELQANFEDLASIRHPENNEKTVGIHSHSTKVTHKSLRDELADLEGRLPERREGGRART